MLKPSMAMTKPVILLQKLDLLYGSFLRRILICNAKLQYHGGTTSMKEHLRRKHPSDNLFDTSDRRHKQRKLDIFTKKRSCSTERAGAISEKITRMIPISMVTGEGFRELIAYIEPEYRLPSATHFTHLTEQRYEAVKQKMREILQGCADSVAITADVWMSTATDSYLTVTAHYLNEQWEIKSIVSGTLPLFESHTASHLATWIKEMVENIGVHTEKIVAFVHDNCKNIDNAGKTLESEHGWFSLGYAGHTLQLCVSSGLETTAIKNAISTGRCLTTHFRKSEPALRALRSRQKDMRVESHNLIADVSTRWNSTYYMIERLVEQRWPLTAVLSDHTVTKSSDRWLDLKSEQWELLTALKELLHPLQVATTYLSAEYNVSVSALYPVLHGLLRSLEPSDDDQPCIRTCKSTIFFSSEIKRRWNLQSLTSKRSSDMLKEVPLMACIVDPRFKKCKFLAAEKHIEIKAALTALVCNVK